MEQKAGKASLRILFLMRGSGVRARIKDQDVEQSGRVLSGKVGLARNEAVTGLHSTR